MPRGCARGNFQSLSFSVPPTKPHAHPEPTCQRCSPGTQGDEGTLGGDRPSSAAPPGRPTNLQDEAAPWKPTAQGMQGKEGMDPGEGSCSLTRGRVCWDRSSSPAPTLPQKQVGAELSAGLVGREGIVWGWKLVISLNH